MVCVFGDRDMRQRALGRQRAFNQPGSRLGLGHAVGAGAAGIFWTDRYDYAELCRNDVQPFCLILANPVHLPTATRTFQTVWLDDLFDPGQILGQIAKVAIDRGAFLTRRWKRRMGIIRRGLTLLDCNRQIFERELALVFGQLLGFPAVQRVAQFFDQSFLALVRFCQHIDPPLHRLKGRTMFGRQYAEIEVVRVWRHGRIIPPRRSSLVRKERPDSLCRSRCPHPSSIDTAPIQALE